MSGGAATVRILTWNVWWRFGPWEAREAAIAATLADVDADVVCLQEVWAEEGGADQATLLAGKLGFGAVTAERRFHGGLSLSNAVLSRWPIPAARSRPLPGADGAPGHRTVLLAEVDAPFGPMQVFTTHLDWEYDAGAVRRRQAAAVAAFVAECRRDPATSFPPVLTGDLNAVPDADELRQLTGVAAPPVPGLVFQDAWALAAAGRPGHTWDGANPYLADATWPGRRLDYVLVAWPRPRPLGNPVACRLVGDGPVDGVWPSDHYGVVADLRTS